MGSNINASEAMNPRNTFESFVVGPNNESAHAAAQAPGQTYNPLFIHGGVGLGKTHLMHAIGQYALGRKEGVKVICRSSERFIDEFIDAIQNHTLFNFRNLYRQADLLLIDDIQILASRERAQEEFLHTFNILFDSRKQMVLLSDRPSGELANLGPRLISRFECGFIAELRPPDVETRIAILQKKAESFSVRLDDKIIELLAERIGSNIRRLEGGLTRVASFSLLRGHEPTLETVEHLVRDIPISEDRLI